jgi:sterol desaturase/sphingolipid hydroxylase (fatty acid hydroxylase superfamily)
MSERIGNTPLLRLDKVARGLQGVTLLAKAEWLNPGGSVKDRAASAMLIEALSQGRLGPGTPLLPREHNLFHWVPFFWGVLILCVAGDLTQYWYHRLHHEVPWLWRFHRTHHSAPYMGMSMASRQNALYSLFFSQTYLTSILVYLGLGPSAVVVLTVKSMITTLAHSSLAWDRPLYRYKALHPLAWVLERTISTPATHRAHHASSTDDGVGFYKGNFGNMFFLWDVIFGTAHISRQYPKAYGISHYESDPWYAQVLWPIFKSNIPGSELAADGPMVRVDSQTENELPEFSNASQPIEAQGVL